MASTIGDAPGLIEQMPDECHRLVAVNLGAWDDFKG